MTRSSWNLTTPRDVDWRTRAACSPSTCPACGGCRVVSLTWMGGNWWRLDPCPDCAPSGEDVGAVVGEWLDRQKTTRKDET